jgi:hypothetical protein
LALKTPLTSLHVCNSGHARYRETCQLFCALFPLHVVGNWWVGRLSCCVHAVSALHPGRLRCSEPRTRRSLASANKLLSVYLFRIEWLDGEWKSGNKRTTARFVDVVRSTRRNRTPSGYMNGPKKKTSPTVCSPRKLWLTYHMVSRVSDSLGREAGWISGPQSGSTSGFGKQDWIFRGWAKRRSGRVWRFR